MEPEGCAVWFTGLSGSGKNTIAQLVAAELRHRGLRVELLAGSEFRQNISQGLGFSREDRVANVRRIGYVAKLLTRNGVTVITTAISPHRAARDECRQEIGKFLEVYVECPIEICEQRDRNGIFEQARAGLLDDVTGITDEYEVPLDPDLTLHSAQATPEELAGRVLRALEQRGWALEPTGTRSGDPDVSTIKARLRALQEN